jgi:NADH:ubiquinone oxidoreductase subunit 5 (subunit L)/multisubunit Na+/H+ antiporter MnhA subunit
MGGLLVAVLLPMAAAGALRWLVAPRSRAAGVVASVVTFACLGLVLAATGEFLEAPSSHSYSWVPQLGLHLTIVADGLSLLFALLITGIGSIVFTFATAYLGPDENRRRFFSYMLLFMGAMLGVVLSGNLISLFVFWELTSISSFLLIGFWHQRQASRDGALKALVVTSTGGLAMLAGFVMVGIVCGSFELTEVIERRELLYASPWAGPAAVLILLGAMTKSAQWPFHFWLPSAMEAPTPVSAFLHAATMVKAGLFLVARLGPLMAGVAIWTPMAASVGLATMVWGSWLALRQTDLKGLLAFSTVSQLGLIMSLLAQAEVEATSAGLLHLLNHGLFKGALFLLVGVIEHEAHTRDLTRLGPLRQRMPRVHLLLAFAALSMAGIPPLGGFVSKELFLEWQLHLGVVTGVVAVFGAVLTAAYSFALAIGLARGRGAPVGEAAGAHDPGASLLWGPAVLVVGAVALGFAPQALVGALVERATAAAVLGAHPHLHLALWHGWSQTVAASAVAIVGGYLFYALRWQPRVITPVVLRVDRLYAALLSGLEKTARAITDSYMSGYLWRYVGFILSVGIVAVATIVVAIGFDAPSSWQARPVRAYEMLIIGVSLLAAVGAVRARTRLAAILALGANGYSVALLFSLLGAPDLALTQVMVETASVALFLAVFVYLPPYQPMRNKRLRPGHMTLAAVFGFGVAGLVYVTRGMRVAPTIAEYFIENSVAKAGGHNIVNVILVDFRGLDTLGEITVLAIAALAAYSIVAGLRTRRDNGGSS